jgi:hypothetical protein
LKAYLPDPKAAIFVSDFKSTQELAHYLKFLLQNESAYEEHRRWRKEFQYSTYLLEKPLFEKSWHCRICEWAADQYYLSLRSSSVVSSPLSPRINNRRCD